MEETPGMTLRPRERPAGWVGPWEEGSPIPGSGELLHYFEKDKDTFMRKIALVAIKMDGER